MFSEHSAAQEIKHIWKLTRSFIGPQILNFERNLNLFQGPKSSLVPPCKISLGGPDYILITIFCLLSGQTRILILLNLAYVTFQGNIVLLK